MPTSRAQKALTHETKTRDEEEGGLEVAGCEKTGPLTAELLAVSSPPMANYRLMPPLLSPDTPFLPKVLLLSRHSLVRKDAVFPNPQLPILPRALITTLTTVTTNAPSVRVRFFAIQKSGHATHAGPFSTCLASRSGRKIKDLPLPSNKVARMAKFLPHANGGVLDAIFRRTHCPKHTRVGARKRSNHVQSLAYHHTLAETLVAEKEFASALIPVS